MELSILNICSNILKTAKRECRGNLVTSKLVPSGKLLYVEE